MDLLDVGTGSGGNVAIPAAAGGAPWPGRHHAELFGRAPPPPTRRGRRMGRGRRAGPAVRRCELRPRHLDVRREVRARSPRRRRRARARLPPGRPDRDGDVGRRAASPPAVQADRRPCRRRRPASSRRRCGASRTHVQEMVRRRGRDTVDRAEPAVDFSSNRRRRSRSATPRTSGPFVTTCGALEPRGAWAGVHGAASGR